MPDGVRRIVEAGAAMAGLTLTEYARRSLEQAARRPSREELAAELSTIEPVDTGETAAEALAHVRDDVA